MTTHTAHGHGEMPRITDTYTHNDFSRDIRECAICGEWIKRDDNTSKCDPNAVRKYKKYKSIKAREEVVINRMNARQEKFEEAQNKDELLLRQLQQQSHNIY